MNRLGGRINRRTGGIQEDNIPKHRATMDIKKFGLPTNPLEMEAKMKVMEPLPTEFWKALENQIRHMQTTADDDFERKVADRLISQYADDRYETLKNEIRLDFANAFRCWLATYHKFKMGKINVDWSEEDSRWRILYEPGDELDGDAFHAMPKVISDYFRAHVDAASDYHKRMVHLKDRNLRSLTDYYLYFKYIVGGNTPSTSVPDDGVGFNELPDGFLQQYLAVQDRDDWRLPEFNVPDCMADEKQMRRPARVPIHSVEIGGDSDEDRETATPSSSFENSPSAANVEGDGDGTTTENEGEGEARAEPAAPDGDSATGEVAGNSPAELNKGKEEEEEEEDVSPGTVDVQEPDEDDDISELPGTAEVSAKTATTSEEEGGGESASSNEEQAGDNQQASSEESAREAREEAERKHREEADKADKEAREREQREQRRELKKLKKEVEAERRQLEESKKEFEREKEKANLQQQLEQLAREKEEFQKQLNDFKRMQKQEEEGVVIPANERAASLEAKLAAVQKKTSEDMKLMARVVEASLNKIDKLVQKNETKQEVPAVNEIATRELKEQAVEQKQRADKLAEEIEKVKTMQKEKTQQLKEENEMLKTLSEDMKQKIAALNAGQVFTKHELEHEINLAEAEKLQALETERAKLVELAKRELHEQLEKAEREGSSTIPELDAIMKRIQQRHVEAVEKVKEELIARQQAEAAEKERVRQLLKPTAEQQATAVEEFPDVKLTEPSATEEMETEATTETPAIPEFQESEFSTTESKSLKKDLVKKPGKKLRQRMAEKQNAERLQKLQGFTQKQVRELARKAAHETRVEPSLPSAEREALLKERVTRMKDFMKTVKQVVNDPRARSLVKKITEGMKIGGLSAEPVNNLLQILRNEDKQGLAVALTQLTSGFFLRGEKINTVKRRKPEGGHGNQNPKHPSERSKRAKARRARRQS